MVLSGPNFCRWVYRVTREGSLVEKSRLQVIRQIAGLGRVPNKTTRRQVVWRNRHQTIWGQPDLIPDDTTGSADNQSNTHPSTVDTVEAMIDIIRAETGHIDVASDSGEAELNRRRVIDGASMVERLFADVVPQASTVLPHGETCQYVSAEKAAHLLEDFANARSRQEDRIPTKTVASSGLPATAAHNFDLDMSPDATLTEEQQEIFHKTLHYLQARLAGERPFLLSGNFFRPLEEPGKALLPVLFSAVHLPMS